VGVLSLHAERHAVAIVCDSRRGLHGLHAPESPAASSASAIVVPGGWRPSAATADFTITAEATGEAILAVLESEPGSGSYYPAARAFTMRAVQRAPVRGKRKRPSVNR